MVNFYDYKSFRGVKDMAEMSTARKLEFCQIISQVSAWERSNLVELGAREKKAIAGLKIASPLIQDRAARLLVAALPRVVGLKPASTESKDASPEGSNELADLLQEHVVLDALEALRAFLVNKWHASKPANAAKCEEDIKEIMSSYTTVEAAVRELGHTQKISDEMRSAILFALAQRNILSLWSLAAGADKCEIEALVESAPGSKRNPMPPIDEGVRHLDSLEWTFNHLKRSLHMLEVCSQEIIEETPPTCDELEARRLQWFKWLGCTMRRG